MSIAPRNTLMQIFDHYVRLPNNNVKHKVTNVQGHVL